MRHPPIPFGTTFGRWTVLGSEGPCPIPPPYSSRSRVLCKCSCGTTRPVEVSALRKGTSLSCGCAAREKRALAHAALCAKRLAQYQKEERA